MAKVLVLMSGGVDSSTAAALLKQAGHEVAGVYLKLWQTADSRQPTALGDECWAQEMRDAARAAAHLKIPFQVWDVTEDYKQRVLQNFYSEYAAGRTPNPDVLCNSEIKFGVGMERAMAAGFDYIATGHYARTKLLAISYWLSVGVDTNKDQSYFLWRLTQDQLAHVIFPIGEYTKLQVRALARKSGLHNWDKKDSQGVCFLGKIELKEFLYGRPLLTSPPRGEESDSFLPLVEGELEGVRGVVRQSGPILDVHGTLLGFHDGLAHFTIGQRQGTKLGGTGPYFVVGKDLAHNTLVVANEKDEPEYRAVEARVSGVRCQVSGVVKCMARTRYRAPLCSVVISRPQAEKSHTLPYDGYEIPHSVRNDEILRVVFDEPQRAVAPGQSIVFYDGDRVIGGGVIASVVLQNSPAPIPLGIRHWTLIR